MPFPLITDLRVAFVYRFMSAGSKYKESVYRRVQIRDFTRQALNEKINKMRERIDSINNAVRKQGFSRPDSLLTKEELKQWKLMQQERKELALKEAADKLRKQVADSLGIQLSDTLTSEQEKAIRKALKVREDQLKQKAETQDSAKRGKRAANAKKAKLHTKEKKGKIKTPGKTGKKTESRKRKPPTKKREMLPVKKKMKRRIKDEEQDTDIPCPQPAVLHLCLHLGRPLSGSGTSAHHRHACTAQLGRHQQR